MRSKLFFYWAGLRWLGLMFLVAPALRAPAAERPPQAEHPLPAQSESPLMVWMGVGSWYGAEFDGRMTASGEIYDMYGATAAHPTLPMGSIVRIVNEETGRSQVVRINDRGPFIEGREIDVSYSVARALGFVERGLAQVRIELLRVPARRAPRPQTEADPGA